jgi:hypothetical protein
LKIFVFILTIDERWAILRYVRANFYFCFSFASGAGASQGHERQQQQCTKSK